VLALDDLYWADADTLAIVENLADNAAAAPLVVNGCPTWAGPQGASSKRGPLYAGVRLRDGHHWSVDSVRAVRGSPRTPT
jgi:hypothetical protein